MMRMGRRRPSGNAWIVSIANLLDELGVESSTNHGLTGRDDDGSMAAFERGGGSHGTALLLSADCANRPGTSPQVTRADLDAARAANWWGRPITVRQDQILER